MGINIPLENITGLGNSTGKAKADWLVGKAAEGYNDFYFADDAMQNVKAVRDALEV
jgi:predicted DNA-binding protein